jgi:hypothetical protein
VEETAQGSMSGVAAIVIDVVVDVDVVVIVVVVVDAVVIVVVVVDEE